MTMPRWAANFVVLIFIATPRVCAAPLAGTEPLTAEGDLGLQMVEGIDRFLLRETAEAMVMERKPGAIVPFRADKLILNAIPDTTYIN